MAEHIHPLEAAGPLASSEALVHAEGEQAHHETHELPNFITLLEERLPHSVPVRFMAQWENVCFSLTAALVISFFFIRAARSKKLIPDGHQNFFEVLVEGIDAFVTGILGPDGRKHVPFLGTLFIYILLMNWSGLIPLMKSATSAWSTTLAIALVTMVYVQITGIREQGLGHYLLHLAGNPSNIFGLILIPLMLVLNLILEIGAVPFSLSLRLFANVSSEDRLLFKFAELNVLYKFVPFFFQLFANILAIIFSLVQAFVFMLLSTVYISLVSPHGDHQGHGEEAAHAGGAHGAH